VSTHARCLLATLIFACGATNGTCIGFFGNWDFLLGGRFHF